jgi:hypothetical protein
MLTEERGHENACLAAERATLPQAMASRSVAAARFQRAGL